MAGERAGELRAVLERRRDILDRLSDEAMTPAEIAKAVDVSRATVTRAMDELGRHGLVERVDGVYRATRLGTALLDTHDRYVEVVSGLVDVDSVLRFIPPAAPFDPALLVDGTSHEIAPGASFQVRERVNEAFREAVAIRGMGRTRSERDSLTIHRQKILEEGRQVDMIFSRALLDHVRSFEWTEDLFAAENLSAWVHESVPYGLFVLDRADHAEMLLLLYDEDEAMKGLIQSSSVRSLAWAESVLESFREEADPYTPAEN